MNKEKLTATYAAEIKYERRKRMAQAISFTLMGTEERWPDWQYVADNFIEQLHQLARLQVTGRSASGEEAAFISELMLNEPPKNDRQRI